MSPPSRLGQRYSAQPHGRHLHLRVPGTAETSSRHERASPGRAIMNIHATRSVWKALMDHTGRQLRAQISAAMGAIPGLPGPLLAQRRIGIM
jgi:hypothetical protein